MNKIEKILSYFYPIFIENTESELNPVLEVAYKKGRPVLNSANTNYSYSELYQLFKTVLKKTEIDWANVNSVLILGFGVGCLVPLIRDYNSSCAITGVELDPKVIELGEKYFGTGKLTNITILESDAAEYLVGCDNSFDLIFIDVFVDKDVPSSIETDRFIASLHKHLNAGGKVIFNKITYSKEVKNQWNQTLHVYKHHFAAVDIVRVGKDGMVIVATR